LISYIDQCPDYPIKNIDINLIQNEDQSINEEDRIMSMEGSNMISLAEKEKEISEV